MVSRIPPASPAAIMLQNSASKHLGCRFIASASDMPPSTSDRVARMTCAKYLCSSWLPRISRHCTSGRPASIITENWRVNTARFFAGTLLALSLRAAATVPALAWAGWIRVTWICSRRSAATTASIVSPMRSPDTFSPLRVRPENANVAIIVNLRNQSSGSLLLSSLRAWAHRRAAARRAARPSTHAGAGHDARATVDHFLQLFAVRRRVHRDIERDLAPEIQRRERLVHGLHAELFLPGLHRRINLVHLVFANQVADAGGRHQDFERYDAALAVGLGQQRLTDDALDDQRQLGADLRLLV